VDIIIFFGVIPLSTHLLSDKCIDKFKEKNLENKGVLEIKTSDKS